MANFKAQEWKFTGANNPAGKIPVRLPLDESIFRCELPTAWRKTNPRRRQANCSLTSRKLPPGNPSPGDWRMAECCLALESARLHNHFLPRSCKIFFQRGQLSSSRPTSRRRKVSSRIWKRGCKLVESRKSKVEGRKKRRVMKLILALDPRPSTLDRFSFRLGKFFRTKTNCRTPTSSATGCKRSSRSRTSPKSKVQSPKSSSRRLLHCCKKHFRPAKSKNARAH